MHEMSLIKALIEQADAIRIENGGERISEIRVEVGPLSGVEPLLLSSAFELLRPQTFTAEAELAIDRVALEARCRDCNALFELAEFHFRCPACTGSSIHVTRGDQFKLVSVTIQSDALTEGV